MNESAPIARAAASISYRLAPGLPSAMLSATVPENRYASWVTITMLRVRSYIEMSRRSTPSSFTLPWVAS